MKHVFVVNTFAGNKSALAKLKELLSGVEGEYEIYCTTEPHDATRFVREYCEQHEGERVRFYACGGDGTLKEVAAGAIGQENAEISCVPLGSGNDFVKYYGGAERFFDIAALFAAEAHPIDVISVNGEMCINVCNFGFESYVAGTMHDVRHKKFIGGKNAYTTGIVKALLFAMKNKATIIADGETIIDGKYLLCTVANGRYVGGGYQCAPRASVDDGMLEVCAVKPISRLSFVKLINYYKEGTHLDSPKFKKIVRYKRAKSIDVKSDENMIVCLDGELRRMNDVHVEVNSGALKFAAPTK